MRVVLASGNAGKLREFARCSRRCGFELVRQSELGIAAAAGDRHDLRSRTRCIKARHAARRCAACRRWPMIRASRSMRSTDAPGVCSARFAGEGASDEDNLDKLLARSQGLPAARRSARYRCVDRVRARCARPGPLIGDGTWEGRSSTRDAARAALATTPRSFPRRDAHRRGDAGGRETCREPPRPGDCAHFRGFDLRDRR